MDRVTKRSLAEIALKVWAVTLLVSSVLQIPGIVSQFFAVQSSSDPMWRVAVASNLVYMVLAAAAGFVILKYAAPLAERLAQPDDTIEIPDKAAALGPVAFGCLGLYFAILGIRNCAGLAYELAIGWSHVRGDNLEWLWRNQPGKLVEAIVQTVAGVALFLGRNGLTTVWGALRKVRSIDAAADEDTE